jgi:hypothetical protein
VIRPAPARFGSQVGAELAVGDMDDREAPALPCAVRTEQVQASRSPPSATPSRWRDEEYRGSVGIRPFGADRMTAKVARGGARMDQPRWVRILAITVGCSRAAMIFKVPPHLQQ